MGSVMKYCNRAIIFNAGCIVAQGNPAEMIDIYKKFWWVSLTVIKKM